MLEQISCEDCGRNLFAVEHGKCMYCGSELPSAIKMSRDEAKAELRRKHADTDPDSHLFGYPKPQRKRHAGNSDHDDGLLWFFIGCLILGYYER